MRKIQFFILTKSIGIYLNMLSYFNLENAKSKAYKLFTSPRKGKLDKNDLPQTLKSAVLETFEYNGETFPAYVWQGNEDVILLIHGWESNASRWNELLQQLKPLRKTIIAIDAPAHGLSSDTEFGTPKYAEYIHLVAQKYRPKILIGHSIGGAAISYFLNKYTITTVEKVIMLGAPSDFKIVSDNFANMLSLNTRIKLRLEDYFEQKFQIELEEFCGHKFAQNFSQKAFIAHDSEDDVVLIAEGHKYAKSWKNAVFVETKGLGHSMHNADLYKKIIEFL